jgi:hypothetical protein
MWPCKNVFHIQVLVIYCFATPPIKPNLGQQMGGVVLLLIPKQTTWTNHYDGPIRSTEQQSVRSYLLHSFLLAPAHGLAVPFTSHRKLCANYAMIKPFSWAKPACFDFSSSNFTVQYHMLSTENSKFGKRRSSHENTRVSHIWGSTLHII